jgi:hypothetical protein
MNADAERLVLWGYKDIRYIASVVAKHSSITCVQKTKQIQIVDYSHPFFIPAAISILAALFILAVFLI